MGFANLCPPAKHYALPILARSYHAKLQQGMARLADRLNPP